MTFFSNSKIVMMIPAAIVPFVCLTAVLGCTGNTALAAGSAVLGTMAAVLAAMRISGQIRRVSDFADNIAAGINAEGAAPETTSELASLVESLRRIDRQKKQAAAVAEQISKGNLSAEPEDFGELDILGKSLIRFLQNIHSLELEIAAVAEAIADGRLRERCNADAFQGACSNILRSVNHSMEALILPVSKAIETLDQVAKRNLTARLTGLYRGDYATFQQALNSTIETLDESLEQVSSAAEQVSTASTQISEGSQVLSHGSSEQANSIEQVSSSLHEVASMSRQNSENAKEARALSHNAELAVEKGVKSMNRLSEAIGRIKASSDSTAKIIKTIDEIAFQTNLLALNAAVEAARAGDAGKGFAVVAEEVRNLAMRSAEAAKNTANLIEGSVNNSEDGVILNQEALKNLSEINGQVKKVGAVMAEIAAASEQQSQGIDQVNTIISKMNLVTQQIAANSEESASGAEELSGQAAELIGIVRTFHLSRSSMRPEASVRPNSGKGSGSDPLSKQQTHKEKNSSVQVSAQAASSRRSDTDEAAQRMPFDERDQMELGSF